MRIFRLLAATIFVAAISALPTLAQPKSGVKPPAATPTPAPASGAAVATVPAKVAFVITDQFKDEKVGILRWIAAAKKLQVEFEPKERELRDIETRIQTITKDITTLSKSAVVDQKSIIGKQEEIARLQREQKFKKEDGEALFKRRYDEVVGPVSADIVKALDTYARQRGITLLLDYGRMVEMGAIVIADKSTDLTTAFIADYNSKNP